MPKYQEKGSVLLFLLLILFAVGSIAAFLIIRTITTSTKRVAQNTEALTVALKSDYQNPFDKKTQYENPFNDYHNPFNDLK